MKRGPPTGRSVVDSVPTPLLSRFSDGLLAMLLPLSSVGVALNTTVLVSLSRANTLSSMNPTLFSDALPWSISVTFADRTTVSR